MGPPEHEPELPKLEWARVPESHRYISKRFQETNYLQAIEGGIDSSHSNFLHASLDAFRVTDSYVEKVRNSSNLRAKYHLLDKAPRFTVKKTDYGLVIGVRRNAEEDRYYWRLTQFLLPSHTMIPYEKGLAIHGHCWVPRDDQTCWVWTISWNPEAPLSEEEWKTIRDETFVHAQGGSGHVPARAQQGESVPAGPRETADREHDRHPRLRLAGPGDSGKHGADCGPHAGTPGHQRHRHHCRCVACCCRKSASSREGREPFTASHGDVYWVRSASLLLKRDVEFDEGARELMKAEV